MLKRELRIRTTNEMEREIRKRRGVHDVRDILFVALGVIAVKAVVWWWFL